LNLLTRIRIGAQAGVLAGLVVAGSFFMADLARLEPLSTPLAFSSGFLGPGGLWIDSPYLMQGMVIVSFGGRLAAFSLLHMMVFTVLGIGAVLTCRACGLPLNALTAAVYGLVACSLVFYAGAWVTDAASVVELPAFGTILLVNLLAGVVMGGYYDVAVKRARATA
jgi:hypothetical protein